MKYNNNNNNKICNNEIKECSNIYDNINDSQSNKINYVNINDDSFNYNKKDSKNHNNNDSNNDSINDNNNDINNDRNNDSNNDSNNGSNNDSNIDSNNNDKNNKYNCNIYNNHSNGDNINDSKISNDNTINDDCKETNDKEMNVLIKYARFENEINKLNRIKNNISDIIEDIEFNLPLSEFITQSSFQISDNNWNKYVNQNELSKSIKVRLIKNISNNKNNKNQKMTLNIASYNINGGFEKKVKEGSMVHKHMIKFDIKIAIIVETWYSDEIKSRENFNINMIPNDYELANMAQAIKYKKRGRYSAGVWILVRKDEFNNVAPIDDAKHPYFSTIIHAPSNTLISGIYVPPSKGKYKMRPKKIYYNYTKFLRSVWQPDMNLILAGDFNAHLGELMGDNFDEKDSNTIEFVSLCELHDLSNLNQLFNIKTKTRVGKINNSICDYGLAKLNNDKLQIDGFNVHNTHYIDSDHVPIYIKLFYNSDNDEMNNIYQSKYRIYVNDSNDKKLKKAIEEAKIMRDEFENRLKKLNVKINCKNVDWFYSKLQYFWYVALIKNKILLYVKKKDTDIKFINNSINDDKLNAIYSKLSNIMNKLFQEIKTKNDGIVSDSNEKIMTIMIIMIMLIVLIITMILIIIIVILNHILKITEVI